MDTIQELQNFRTKLIQEINLKFDAMIQTLREGQDNEAQTGETIEIEYEIIYPLNVAPVVFKGKKPTGVCFPDRTRVNVPTWKRVVEAILVKCNNEPQYHKVLMELRDKVQGRERVFVGSSKENMRSPLKIDEKLYIETHYDTETLLRILTMRILEPINYDYSGIMIAIRNEV